MFDRNRWEMVLKDRTWDEIFQGLNLSYKKDRGGKYVVQDCCPSELSDERFCNGEIAGRPNGTFVCRECKKTGDMVDFILANAHSLFILMDVPTDEELMEETFNNMPPYKNPNQRRLFPEKDLKLSWA